MEKTQGKIDVDHESLLVEQAMCEARPFLAPWFGEDGLRENLATEISRDLKASRDEGVCTMTFAGGGTAIVYIAPGELTEPMPEAHIRHRTFALGDKRELGRLAEEVREQLAPYPPENVLMYTYGDQQLSGMPVNMRVVAGLIDEVHLPPGVESPAKMRLEEPSSLDFYDQYHAWYEEFWRRRPHLRDEIHVETKEDIAECHKAGGVRLVFLDDEPCGLLAAQPRCEFALRGWRMRERVIAPDLWGSGLSTPALVAFAKSLRHTSRDAIWGTIHKGNPWSLETARRAGRKITATLHEI